MNLIQYILISAACLGVSYLAYRLFLRKVTQFHHLRLFLVGSLVLALVLPLASVRIDYSTLFIKENSSEIRIPVVTSDKYQQSQEIKEPGFFAANRGLFIRLYLIIALMLILRVAILFLRLLRLYYISDKKQEGNNLILYSTRIKSPFSFFHWIFIPQDLSDNEEKESIIIHESIHASQYHSIDNLLIEPVAAVMWFNPLVWMMKDSLHQVHEYLADEGALSTGIDRLRYQALLINQVTEERLICLSSGLNHSLIKKRMIMMTKSKNYPGRKLKILTLLPLSAILFLMVALLNGLFPREIQAKSTGQNLMAPSKPVIPDDTTKKKTYTIKVISHEKSATNEIKVICEDSVQSHQVIYIVDGVQVKDISNIEPDSVETVNVIKDDNLIIVRTKGFKKGHPEKIVIKNDGQEVSDNVTIYINGEKSTKADLDKLDPDQIQTIDVIKDKSSEGVIKVTTKTK